MYALTVKRHFDAAHYLRGYGEPCEGLHGHRYEIALTVRSSALDEIGVVWDFRALKELLSRAVEAFDHTCLNELPDFADVNPSAENIALRLYQRILPGWPTDAPAIDSVAVWESPDACAVYYPSDDRG